jgi:hypothetical protein
MNRLDEKFHRIDAKAMTELMDLLSMQLNLGAGIQISGDSGSGKSNLGEQMFIRNFEQGIPSAYFDPHGDSVNKIHKILLEKSRSRTARKLIFLRPSDLTTAFGFNPLYTTHNPVEEPVAYAAQVNKRVETTAKIIFSLFGESNFEGRTKLRQYLTLWLKLLAQSKLTLADATFLADPDSPVYRQLVDLAPDPKSKFKLEKLVGQKQSEVNAEIGSTESRVMPVLDHPVCQMMFSRRENNIDFRWLIDNDYSLLVDLSMSSEVNGKEFPDALTEEVQQLICNLMLTQYLDTVLSIPLEKRRQRLLFIDELPVFESSAPILMKACTEIRKFLTKFVFMHQGSTRFQGGHDNEFLQAISKMCTANVFFAHSGDDADYFASPFARQLYDMHEIKYEHWADQEFSLDPEIIELLATSESSSTQESKSRSTGSSSQTTTSQGDAQRRQESALDTPYATDSRNKSDSLTSTESNQSSSSTTSANSVTRSQALKSRSEVRRVLQSVQFASADEQAIDVTNLMAEQLPGECMVQVKGMGILRAKTELTSIKFPNLKSRLKRYVAEFFDKQKQLPWFSDANEEYRNRLQFVDSIAGYLGRLIEERKQRSNPRLDHVDLGKELSANQPAIEGSIDNTANGSNDREDQKSKGKHDPDSYEGDF